MYVYSDAKQGPRLGKHLNCKLCVGQPAKTKRSGRVEGAPQSCWINSSPFAPLETVTGGTPLNLICKRINLVLYSPAKFQRGEFSVSFDWILFRFIYSNSLTKLFVCLVNFVFILRTRGLLFVSYRKVIMQPCCSLESSHN